MSKQLGAVVYRDEETGEFYQLHCPDCGSSSFFYTELFQSVEIGDKITCGMCSRTFIITGNCYRATGVGTRAQTADKT